jgi:hypothetical protein
VTSRNPHVIANAVLMVAAGVLHLMSIGSVTLNVVAVATENPLFGPAPKSEPELLGMFIGFGWMAIAAMVGVVWAPLNAYGLLKRRPWARRSTLGYWAFVGVLCCCIPGAAYGFFSLTRHDVRRELGPS